MILLSAEQVAEYSTLMAESQKMVATEVLASFNFRDHNVLLDVGGGEGAFLKAVAAQHDHLQLRLFDLPQVVERAASRFEEVGLSGRAQVHGGSFFDDPLPQGADLASLVRILHDHDDEPAQAILDSVYAALPSGGKLLIAEPMSTGGSAHRYQTPILIFICTRWAVDGPAALPCSLKCSNGLGSPVRAAFRPARP
ncbi:MAG: methyltransferase [Pseudomonadota bacterium]